MSEPKGAVPSGLRNDGGATDGAFGRPEASEQYCGDGVCITCSDTAVEVTVLRLLADELAVVDTGAGDTILVHAREAIAVVGK
jgi:hydrogenase expression/formation protein HypC